MAGLNGCASCFAPFLTPRSRRAAARRAKPFTRGGLKGLGHARQALLDDWYEAGRGDKAELRATITAKVQPRGEGRRRGACLPRAAHSNLLDSEARRQRLLQLVGLVRVHNAQRVQVLAAADLELGRARSLLDLDGCGARRAKAGQRCACCREPERRRRHPNPRVKALGAAASRLGAAAWLCDIAARRSRCTHALQPATTAAARRKRRMLAFLAVQGHAQRASFRRAVSRKSLISMISFG